MLHLITKITRILLKICTVLGAPKITAERGGRRD
jgi:hypothetical protein